MKISILCPSRGRPVSCEEMVHSAMINAAKPFDVEVLVYVDDDDPLASQYNINDVIVRGPRIGVGRAWNVLAEKCTGDILWMGNDDLRYVATGWDESLREAFMDIGFDDGIAMVYCDDGINGKQHAAFPAVSRHWYRHLGYFAPECFRFFYHDTWIQDVARRVGRVIYHADKLIEHRHHTTEGGVRDATTEMNRNDGQAEQDRATWDRFEYARKLSADILLGEIAKRQIVPEMKMARIATHGSC